MNRSEIIRVSSKGQIVLPKRYRDKMGIREGDYVSIHELEDGVLLIERAPQSMLDVITTEFRAEAKERGFTREELAQAIKAKRAERRSNAA
ncbi:MAG: AbrB/MazE/SpoVT family DNA-binding domain-containing protein [Armatimonadetes bacterium]|nr:AbrB/MazE/SpoVT family DNA-binding domain-containing protein [Armatimonadota bacterium]